MEIIKLKEVLASTSEVKRMQLYILIPKNCSDFIPDIQIVPSSEELGSNRHLKETVCIVPKLWPNQWILYHYNVP
jgi:hypothetical protein